MKKEREREKEKEKEKKKKMGKQFDALKKENLISDTTRKLPNYNLKNNTQDEEDSYEKMQNKEEFDKSAKTQERNFLEDLSDSDIKQIIYEYNKPLNIPNFEKHHKIKMTNMDTGGRVHMNCLHAKELQEIKTATCIRPYCSSQSEESSSSDDTSSGYSSFESFRSFDSFESFDSEYEFFDSHYNKIDQKISTGVRVGVKRVGPRTGTGCTTGAKTKYIYVFRKDKRKKKFKNYVDQIENPYWIPQGECKRFVGTCNVGTDIKEVAFWNDDVILAASDSSEVFAWKIRDGKLLNVLKGHSSHVNCVQVHPTGAYLATSGIDKYIQIWQARADKPFVFDKSVQDGIYENQKLLDSSNSVNCFSFVNFSPIIINTTSTTDHTQQRLAECLIQ